MRRKPLRTSTKPRTPSRYNAEQTVSRMARTAEDLIDRSPAPAKQKQEALRVVTEALAIIPALFPVRSDDAFKTSFLRRWQEARSLPDYNEKDWMRSASLLGIELVKGA